MLKDLLKYSRSYRGFDESRSILRSELADFVDCARYAPSSVNLQPLKYLLVYEKENLSLLQPLTKWAAALPNLQLPHHDAKPTAFIVICHDKTISSNMDAFQKDLGIVAQTMLLAAAERALGGCIIGNFKSAEVSQAFNLSPDLVPRLIVAFGKPREKIILTEVGEDGATKYYRDDNDVHHVPKRALDDLLL